MAGKKKKKPSANPARGFATISQPSKSKEPVPSDDEVLSQDQEASISSLPNAPGRLTTDDTSKGENNDDKSRAIDKMTPEELEAYLEDAELQNLVEQHAARVRADVTRQVSRLKNERRQLRQQADRAIVTGLTDDLVENIVYSSLQVQSNPVKTSALSSASELQENEVLLKLWLLQEVLKQLKITSSDEALASVLHAWRQHGIEAAQNSVWGLDEALIWYAGADGAVDSPTYDLDQIVGAESTSQIETLDDTHDGLRDVKMLNRGEIVTDDLATRVVDTVPHTESVLTSSDEDNDPDDLIDRWLRLRTKLFNKEQESKLTFNGQLQFSDRRLTDRIKLIERDVLFDSDLAQRRWQTVLKDLEIESGKARKRATHSTATHLQRPALERLTDARADEDALLGSMFDDDIDGESQSQSTVNLPETSIHHDFGSWTGMNPQRLLDEACNGFLDRNGIQFRSLHVTSFSARFQLNLDFRSSISLDDLSLQCIPQGIEREQKPRRLTLKMSGTATKSVLQSEAYLATVALFLLISADVVSAKIAPRLPKVWKEVLADLDRSRDELVLKQDICKLRHLRSIIRAPVESDEGTSRLQGQERMSVRSILDSEKIKAAPKDHPERAKEKWLQRATSAEFALMQPARHNLPVHAFKSEILHAFHENPILIICADTGAGKSTQIPSYILEDELSGGQDYRILVTQPRRISAISIARRVSSELGENKEALGTARSLVGYAIRMESKISHSTRITFATTGVLLRMLQESPNLDHLDCLVLDEVHERTMDLDLLFIALKRLRRRRGSLKIVLMSATVDATKFSTYFDNAPILDIPGRTFPVRLGFLEDAIEATLDIKDNGHGPESPEDDDYTGDSDEIGVPDADSTGLEHYSLATRRVLAQYDYVRLDYNLILRLTTAIATKPEFREYSKAVLIFMPGISEIRRLYNIMLSTKTFSSGWVLHMLHSSFSTQDLEKAFLLPPPGCRKIVIATNIAETGITIPDVTAVIDTCKEKIMRFDERRQISRLTEGFIARASARQRKGRAARVQNGLCFHLVTKHHFETRLQDQPTPEMLRLSLQDPILRIKVWDLGAAEEILSAALDPPSVKNIRRALSKLQDVGAFDSSEKLTALGKNLAKLPLDVAMGKMALLGVFLQSLDAIVTIIASFSTKSIFANDNTTRSSAESFFARGDSDPLTVYNAYSGWRKSCEQRTSQQFCQKYHLSQFQLRQLEEQKVQLLVYLADAGLMPLSQAEQVALQNARHSRSNLHFFDVPGRYNQLSSDTMINAVVAMAFYPKLLKRESRGYRNVYSNQQLQIAPTSINKASAKPPDWLCYLEATQAKNGRLNAFHSSKVSQAMLIVLMGQADFKFYAGVVDIDHGRIRLSLRKWKELLALQHLRRQIHRMIQDFLAKPGSPSPADQAWLETMAVALDGLSQSGVHVPNQLLQA